MGEKSDIEWTDATWNPVAGCTKISPGVKIATPNAWLLGLKKSGIHATEMGFT
jgi:protein gp37